MGKPAYATRNRNHPGKLMKIILIALALIANSLFTGFIDTPAFQEPASSTKIDIQINVSHDKKKDVTKLFLQPLMLWSNRTPDQSEQVRLFVGFECPNKKIVRPTEVLFTFSARSENFVSFPSLEFSVLLDGAPLELGRLKGSQRNDIHPLVSRVVYEDESITISHDDFTRIATAGNVTIMIGKRKFDLSSRQIRLLREFHKVMQREGQEIK